MLTETFDISAVHVTEQKRLLLYEPKGTCSGPVYALSGEKTQLVSGQGWGQEEGQKMCEYLQCGKYMSHSIITKDTKEWWRETYNCSGKTDIWDCERHDQASKLSEQLNIICDCRYHLSYKLLLFENSIFLAALPTFFFFFDI